MEKIQTSLLVQQGQQWIITWFAEARQVFYKLYNNQNIQNIKEIVQHLLIWIEKTWEHLQFQYYNIHFNITGFYRQIKTFYNNEGIKIILKIL